ncbi:alpha/beta fold hydrolase [Acuticoccus sp.]|uniref:alpha/beta fold hydrolase n=1 Tax=Acuticoccus sp. TaxID=1904378 RepID=UPI003B52E07B
MATNPLPHRTLGSGGPPIVLIHGFGADRTTWSYLLKPLARARQVIAFDLPGHGEAVDWSPTPDAVACAKAVIASLGALGVDRACLIGHSLGGAVASLVGLFQPALAERLILLAPGGFGREMNVPLLREYAALTTEDEARAILPSFFGPASPVPDAMPRLVAEQHESAALRQSLQAIVGAITKGDGQGVLPLDDLVAKGFPITLAWGTEDGVLPVSHAIDAPALIARHLMRGIGHMPHIEAPETVERIVRLALMGTLGDDAPAARG